MTYYHPDHSVPSEVMSLTPQQVRRVQALYAKRFG